MVNESFESLRKMANDNNSAISKLLELNVSLWNKISSKQLELFKLCFESSTKPLSAQNGVTSADEFFKQQMEMARECGEKAAQINKEVIELFSSSREDYQEWYDSSVKHAQEQLQALSESSNKTGTRKAA